ncbi:hypothetical protein LDENG_00266990 [Lucifuga dentata]|nr:hypothetical protein LDENG_00266990 [Lucifuga dentata]
MELLLPPPSLLLELPGEPPVAWSRWLESFEMYIVAICLSDASEERCKAILIHNLGVEGQRLFRTLGPANTYAACMTKLNRHFTTPQSTILQWIVFQQRQQQTGESVHHYLRGLASTCKFGTMEDEFIRDQLAEHSNNPKVCEKLIMSPDNLPLSKAVEIAFQIESAVDLTSQLSLAPPLPSQSTLLTQTLSSTPSTPDTGFPPTAPK